MLKLTNRRGWFPILIAKQEETLNEMGIGTNRLSLTHCINDSGTVFSLGKEAMARVAWSSFPSHLSGL
jgi:hypothetical protein